MNGKAPIYTSVLKAILLETVSRILDGNQCWQLGAPKFGPTRYLGYRSIHRAGIGLGLLSPAPNRTQPGRAEMEAKPGSGRDFVRSVGSGFASHKPGINDIGRVSNLIGLPDLVGRNGILVI